MTGLSKHCLMSCHIIVARSQAMQDVNGHIHVHALNCSNDCAIQALCYVIVVFVALPLQPHSLQLTDIIIACVL